MLTAGPRIQPMRLAWSITCFLFAIIKYPKRGMSEAALPEQILLKYGVNLISFSEADLLAEQVCATISAMYREEFADSLFGGIRKGLDTHVKSKITFSFSYDSRSSSVRSMEWYVQNSIMGRFANMKERRLCNTKFLTIGEDFLLLLPSRSRRARKCLSSANVASSKLRISMDCNRLSFPWSHTVVV